MEWKNPKWILTLLRPKIPQDGGKAHCHNGRPYLVVQHSQTREAAEDASFKEIRKDPYHGHVGVTAAYMNINGKTSQLLGPHQNVLDAE